MWAGIAGIVVNGNTQFEVSISIHDSVYNTDFASSTVPYDANDPEAQAKSIENHVLQTLRHFSQEHVCKFLGAGVTLSLLKEVCDIVDQLTLPVDSSFTQGTESLHSSLARYGYSSNRLQHQTIPH